MTKDFKFMCTCQMCGSPYQMGKHIYEGKHIAAYKLDACKNCYDANWDGWGPHYEEKLLAHIKDKGLPTPERNEGSWFPRG